MSMRKGDGSVTLGSGAINRHKVITPPKRPKVARGVTREEVEEKRREDMRTLRAAGNTWFDIAMMFGYSDASGARDFATRRYDKKRGNGNTVCPACGTAHGKIGPQKVCLNPWHSLSPDNGGPALPQGAGE